MSDKPLPVKAVFVGDGSVGKSAVVKTFCDGAFPRTSPRPQDNGAPFSVTGVAEPIVVRGEPCEVFAVLFLDNKHRVIGFEKMFYGTVDGAAVYPREVVRRALEYNAASVIVAHNHPSGVAEPSQADRDVTERLRRALDLIDVRILDHLVIGDGHWESFSRRGWV